MFSFILKRLLYGIPIILGTTLILFLIFNVVPGDPVLQIVGKHATPELIELKRQELGLDKPLFVQYVDLLKQLVTFDFGRSYQTKQEISQMVLDGIGPSVALSAPAFALAIIISLCIGILVAMFRGTWIDRGVVALCVAGQSVSLLVYILFGQYYLTYVHPVFPVTGYDNSSLGGLLHTLMLPGMIFILLTLAPQVRFYRTIILDEIYQDYVRTARSKGLGETAIMLKHVLKNAMIPIITDIIINIPFLILGSVLLESYFGIPGIGDMIVRGIANNDRPVLISLTVLMTTLFVFFNIISDILYAWVDPRVQLK